MVGVSKRRQVHFPPKGLTGCKRFANVRLKIRDIPFTPPKSWMSGRRPPCEGRRSSCGAGQRDDLEVWRLRPESNRRTRICNPLRDHSATEPFQKARHLATNFAACNLSFSCAVRLSRIAPLKTHDKGLDTTL